MRWRGGLSQVTAGRWPGVDKAAKTAGGRRGRRGVGEGLTGEDGQQGMRRLGQSGVAGADIGACQGMPGDSELALGVGVAPRVGCTAAEGGVPVSCKALLRCRIRPAARRGRAPAPQSRRLYRAVLVTGSRPCPASGFGRAACRSAIRGPRTRMIRCSTQRQGASTATWRRTWSTTWCCRPGL
jgi:hypothetical protein